MKFSLVKIDETKYFDCLPHDIGRIFTVYMYNPDEQTHCCEITPSYYLIPVDCYAERTHLLSDEPEKERVYDILENSMNGFEGIYRHCSSIDQIGDEFKFTSKNDFESEDEAFEYYRSNHCL